MDAGLAKRADGPQAMAPALLRAREPRLVTNATPNELRGGVLLLGNFDGFHRGHQALLRQARQVARGRPLGAMSVEPHPRTLFGGEGQAFRLTGAATKLAVLGRAGLDFVYAPRFDFAFAAQSPQDFVENILVGGLGVAHAVCGTEFRFGRRRAGDVATLGALGRRWGFAVSVVEPVLVDGTRCSSSLVRARLAAGDVAGAERALGYRWFFDATVSAAAGSEVALALSPETAPLAPGTYRVMVGNETLATPAELVVPRRVEYGAPRLRLRRPAPVGSHLRLTLIA